MSLSEKVFRKLFDPIDPIDMNCFFESYVFSLQSKSKLYKVRFRRGVNTQMNRTWGEGWRIRVRDRLNPTLPIKIPQSEREELIRMCMEKIKSKSLGAESSP